MAPGWEPPCPECGISMRLQRVRGLRYWTCDGPGCRGVLGDRHAPRCPWCPRQMQLQVGTRGRHVGRWFWHCSVHRRPNIVRETWVEDAGEPISGPADP